MNMTLSKRGDYVMRSAISLARAFENGEGRKIREVVEETEVPRTFASQILADLVRADLAVSKAGRDGGYRLARPPVQISVLEVVEAAEGTLRAERCALGAGPCRWDDVCPLHETWSAATAAMRELLAETSLAEVAARDAAIEAGTYAVPSDAHRSHPLAVEVADVVHVERDVDAVRAAFAAAATHGLAGHVVAAVAEALEPGEAAAPVAAPKRRRGGGASAEVAAAPSDDGGPDADEARWALEWRVPTPFGERRFEGELAIVALDEQRSEVRLRGGWHQEAAPLLDGLALEREARSVVRRFLRRLAGELEEEHPQPAPRAKAGRSRARSPRGPGEQLARI